MKLEIERSGGFAGLTKKVTVDTKDLPNEMVVSIIKYLDSAKSKSPSPIMSKNKRIPDSYFYRISSKLGNKKEVEFNESELDDILKVFIDYVFKNY